MFGYKYLKKITHESGTTYVYNKKECFISLIIENDKLTVCSTKYIYVIRKNIELKIFETNSKLKLPEQEYINKEISLNQIYEYVTACLSIFKKVYEKNEEKELVSISEFPEFAFAALDEIDND